MRKFTMGRIFNLAKVSRKKIPILTGNLRKVYDVKHSLSLTGFPVRADSRKARIVLTLARLSSSEIRGA